MKKNSPEPDRGTAVPHRPRLLFVGEGPHDIGRTKEPGGALAGFVCAVLCGPGEPLHPSEMPFEIADIRIWTTLQLAGTGKKSRARSFNEVLKLKPGGERARAALLLAATQGLDGVVILRDCEHTDNLGLGDGLRQAREEYAKREPQGRPALVIAAPSRCHETWLLADREAVGQVLEKESIYHFSGDPEERPHCDTLKAHIEEHTKRLHRKSYVVRAELAFLARPAELAKRCRGCYPPFQEDIETELRARFELPNPD